MIPFLIMLIYSLSLFATMMFKTSMRHGDEILLSMTKIPPDDLLESLYKMRIRESVHLKNCFRIVRRGGSSKDIDARLSTIEDDGGKKHRSENSDSETLTPEMRG